MHSLILSPFFIVCIVCGIIFTLGGWLFQNFPPKKINNWYGYRTPASQKNQERWDFAQEYSSKEMIRMGAIFILVSFIGFFLPGSLIETFAAIVILLILTITLIYRVEIAIKKKFN
jgi:uncharacterized membrane protein